MRHPRQNITHLLSESMVSQFEVVVKEEIRKHEASLMETNKELQRVLLLFESLNREYQKTRCNNEADYQKTQEHVDRAIKELEEKFSAHQFYLKGNEKNIREYMDAFLDAKSEMVSKKDFECFKEEIYSTIGDVNIKIEERAQDVQKEIQALSSEVANRFELNRGNLSEIVKILDNKIDDLGKHLNEHVVDADGVLRELQVYKKSMYILEKKIEDLYTLVERLKRASGR